jgi:hypothetical protein
VIRRRIYIYIVYISETSVPRLNDARIHVKLSETKGTEPEPTLATGPVLQKYSEKPENTNPAKGSK